MSQLTPWYQQHVSDDFHSRRQRFLAILEEETSLMEIVKLIGADVLADQQQLVLEIGRCIRVGYLQQNAFHDFDCNVSLQKQDAMMKLILYTMDQSSLKLADKIPLQSIRKTHIFDTIIGVKYLIDDNLNDFNDYYKKVDEALASIE